METQQQNTQNGGGSVSELPTTDLNQVGLIRTKQKSYVLFKHGQVAPCVKFVVERTDQFADQKTKQMVGHKTFYKPCVSTCPHFMVSKVDKSETSEKGYVVNLCSDIKLFVKEEDYKIESELSIDNTIEPVSAAKGLLI